MAESFFDHIKAALKKIRSNPQLIYTIVVAALIIGAFAFMANRFISIAYDAQERLVNVRIGSLQDGFVSFAADRMDDLQYLNARIADAVRANETIRNFRIIRKETVFTDATTTAYLILASNDPQEIGRADPQASFLYALALADPEHSITTELGSRGNRLFNTARAVVGQDGSILGVVMTSQTLSAADKAIERNIARSIYLLAGVIILVVYLFFRQSKIIDYMDLYRRLKEVDQLKDDFISMASHELRTPLTVIRGYAEFVSDAPELAQGTREYVSRIETSSKDLDALISDMLDVSRIEQGRIQLKMEVCDPASIVQATVEGFQMLAKEKGLQLSYDGSAASGKTISVDKDRLHQVLVNLIGNAIKYTPKGSVQVRLYDDAGRLYIRISDTGLGMSAEQRERLFEKFYRIKTKGTENITGTGLGLWITARLIKEMKGTIGVESIEGVGSHFIVSFPTAA